MSLIIFRTLSKGSPDCTFAARSESAELWIFAARVCRNSAARRAGVAADLFLLLLSNNAFNS